MKIQINQVTVSYTPKFSGNGYDYGGAVMLTIEGTWRPQYLEPREFRRSIALGEDELAGLIGDALSKYQFSIPSESEIA
jgi:hypothetical protein